MSIKYAKTAAVLLFAAGGFTSASAQVSLKVGSNPFGLTASAALEIESTTKGFLPPRMSASQRDLIATPATGLTIYNTDNNLLEVNTGTALIPVWKAATVSNPAINTKTAAYTATSTDNTILCDATTLGFTLTLPLASTVTGKVYTISKVDDSSNVLTISPSLALTKTVTVSTLNFPRSFKVQSDGTNWNVLE